MRLVIFALLLLAVAGTCQATMTEQDFKKMKIKDLKQFLDDRGLTCPGCQEKSDFVRVAYQNRDKTASGSMAKREVPNLKFWDAWSANALKVCEALIVKRGNDPSQDPYASICETVQQAVEAFLMQNSKTVSSRLKKTPDHLLKTSYKGVYYDAGERVFQKLANHCLSSPMTQAKCSSLGYILKVMQDNNVADYRQWVTNVGIENTNPMYEILEENLDL